MSVRAVVGGWGEHATTRLAHALGAVDEIRAAAWRRRRDAVIHDLDAQPDAILAVLAHWRPERGEAVATRLSHLEQCVAGILELSARRVVAVVLTNDPRPTAHDLAGRLRGRAASVPVRVAPVAAVAAVPAAPREVLVVGWRPRLRHRHGFYLTWAHVPLLRAAARTDRFSHLIYLEDDMRFTDAHLSYWRRYRRPLAEHGLLPGFVRFEWRDGERYVVDALRPVDPALRRRLIRIAGEPVHFVNLDNPYQALYVLDREFYEHHFRFSRGRSPLRSRTSEWEVRERAATGPIFDDVPHGLVSRNVVPVLLDGDRQRLDPVCLVEHVAPTKSSTDSPFGVLRVADLFAAPVRPQHAQA
jgi:hypothetical protein